MIFYDCLSAPSPRRARIFLAEKQATNQLDVDHKQIDLRGGEQLSDEFRSVNPRCTVPVLVLDDGTALTENLGIAAYLDAAYPDPPLMGSTPAEKGVILGCNAQLEIQGLMPVAEALRNSSPAMSDRAITGPDNFSQIPALAERGLRRLDLFFDWLNDHLSNRDYLATGAFSLADVTAAVAVDFARVVKVTPQNRHSALIRWRARLDERPSMHV